MKDFGPTEGLTERVYWLIRLRWIAVAGVFFAVFFVTRILDFSLPTSPLYAIVSFLFFYNLLFFFLINHFKKKSVTLMNRFANVQISIDLFILTGLIHFSGGIENPFIFYFIFHTIIASILLSRKASFLQATLAVILFAITVISEYAGILPHYCLEKFTIDCQSGNPVYLSGVSVVFVSTLYIAAYMATSISKRLRQHEKILEETNKQLKEKDRIKSEYVLRVSHDIKEHLAAIQGCLEPVLSGITGELNSKQSDLVRRAVDRTVKLVFFVKALLETTRIRLNREIKISHFSFKDAFYEAISYVETKAKEKNISLTSRVDPSIDRIKGTEDYIQETLTNLLMNSVKYTPPHGKVDVHASDKGNHILIEIADNGIGIPKNDLPRIFEEFFRASNAKQLERDGTGLGLFIAKQIIELNNGKIWLESEEGKGTTFYIELPK